MSACSSFTSDVLFSCLSIHDGHHLDSALARPAGTALLSVSNHIATIDDPHLLASIVPYRTLLHAGREMRWGVCASDVCFRPDSVLSRLADSAKVLPVERHAGVWQRQLDTVVEKLSAGEWVHYFPEGKIRQDGRIHPFQRGVGRLAASVDGTQVLPFYHTGCEIIQPTTPSSDKLFSRPSFGTEVGYLLPSAACRLLPAACCSPPAACHLPHAACCVLLRTMPAHIYIYVHMHAHPDDPCVLARPGACMRASPHVSACTHPIHVPPGARHLRQARRLVALPLVALDAAI